MKRKLTMLFILLFFSSILFSEDLLTNSRHKLIGLKPEYFSNSDELVYLGDIDRYTIFYNKHYWGNNRISGRIVIFKDSNPLGSYGVINDMPTMNGTKLFFEDYDKDYGNSIDLSNGVKDQVFLDGEEYFFEYFSSIEK